MQYKDLKNTKDDNDDDISVISMLYRCSKDDLIYLTFIKHFLSAWLISLMAGIENNFITFK